MPTPSPTVDELVATLKRSYLPTVIVEGGDDVSVYRWVEEKIGRNKANFLPCGGRSALLEIYTRRHEFSQISTAFVADRDMWLFTAIPAEYGGIIWTTGYSVENDLYAGAKLEALLDKAEAEEHSQVLQSIIEWFSFEVEEYRAGQEAQVDTHSLEVVPPGKTEICAQFIMRRGFRKPQKRTVNEISRNFRFKIRGKTLFQILVRYLSASKRHAKYSVKSLCEIAFKTQNTHRYMARIIKEIEESLSINSPH